MCSNKIRTPFVPTNTYLQNKKADSSEEGGDLQVDCRQRTCGKQSGVNKPKGGSCHATWNEACPPPPTSLEPSPGKEVLGA